ncbi:MAG: SAM-dependent methyltransferase [Mycobacterium sp.]|nr:SAM-dependent methyltransferase [Mycobacterium sp.]
MMPSGSDQATCRSDVLGAQVRAKESASGRPLFTDRYVQTLLDGLGAAALEGLPGPALSAQLSTRTKWYDEFFVASGASGISQVVILAAGLDSRPWRLPWLADTVVYEIDRPEVLAYKSATLRAAGAETTVKYVPVPADPEADWSIPLCAAGFDHTEPTAWSAEGVLASLSDIARDQLFDQITRYSARGSRISMDAAGAAVEDINCLLCTRGWEISLFSAHKLMHRYHRDSADDTELAGFGGCIEGRLL